MTLTEDEALIVELARALFAQGSDASLYRLLEVPRKTPPRLGPEAIAVLEDTLSKGAALFVARNGAWRKEQGGRLWERATLPRLVFTGASFQFLRWMLSTGPRTAEALLLPTHQAAANGDELLLVAALGTTTGTPWQAAVAWQPMVRESALCAAGFAAELGAVRTLDAVPAFDLTPGGWHAFAFAGLAELFAHHWAEAEFNKRHETLPARLAGASQAQDKVLEALLVAAAPLSSRGPITFLLEAARKVLAAEVSAQAYGSALSNRTTLRERSEARLASGAFLRGLLKLGALDASHRQTRFTDEGYDAAQALVGLWESHGPTRAQWATIEPTLSALGSA